MVSVQEIVKSFSHQYDESTPKKIKMIDMFLAYSIITGVLQFCYLLLVGDYPYNSFLAGFICSVGFFILTVCLRLQVTNPKEFNHISPERAFFDYVFCNAILFFVVVTFIN